MKTTSRIVLGIVSLFVVALGIRRVAHGLKETSGTSGSTQPQTIGERTDVASHGCSLRVPRGWEQKGKPNGSVMFVAPERSGISANLIVFSEPFDDTLRKYADAIVDSAKISAPAARFDGVEPFTTESGVPSFRVSFHQSSGGVDVAQAMYFFTGRATQKILITTTSSAASAADLGPLWEACSRSLTVTAL